MSNGDDGYYFDQQAADDAAYQANMRAYETPAPVPVYEAPAQSSPPAYEVPIYDSPGFVDPSYTGSPMHAFAPAQNYSQTVNDIYQQEFGRQADASGMASFTAAINAGMTGEQMREALRSSAEGQSYGLSPHAPAAPVGQFEYQPEMNTENGVIPAYFLNTTTGDRKEASSVYGPSKDFVDVNNLAYHLAPNYAGTPTQFYDADGNLKAALIGMVPYGGSGEYAIDPMSLGLALDKGEKVSINSAIQARDEQNRLLFIDPYTGETTPYNTGVPAKTGQTVRDRMYINDPMYNKRGIIPKDVYEGMALLAATMATGGVGGALMSAAGVGGAAAAGGLTAAEAAALMGGTLSEAGAASMLGGTLASQGMNYGAALTSAAKSAAINAAVAAAQGGKPADILRAAGTGAISGGVGALGADYFGAGTIGQIGTQTATAAAIAAASGRDPMQAALSGALSATLANVIPSSTSSVLDGLPESVQRAANTAISSSVIAAIQGGNVGTAALMGVANSAISSVAEAIGDTQVVKDLRAAVSGQIDQIVNDFKFNTGATNDQALPIEGSNRSPVGEVLSADNVSEDNSSISNSDFSDQILKDVLSRNNLGSSVAQNNASFDFDTGYRAESFPVAAPANAEFAPLEAGPLDKETQAQIDAIAAKQKQNNYSAVLNAKLSNVNSIINLVPDTLGLLTGIGKSIEAEIKAATSALANSTEYTRPTDEQVSAIFRAAQDFYAPIRDLVFDATQIDATSPEAKSGLITKTLTGIGKIMHAASVPVAEATGMPVEYVESVLALAGPKIVGKTFNLASALGADIVGGGWGNALSNVMSKAENLGIVPKAEMYAVEPKQGLGSLGAKPFAEAEGGIAALLKDYTPTNTPLLDSLLAKERPAMLLVDSLLKDYKPTDPIPAGVKSQVKTSVDNVYAGLAKDAPSAPMSEFLQTLVYGGASLKDVGAAVDLAMQGSGGGGGNNPDAIIQEVSKATENLDEAKKVPATFAFLVNTGILGVTPSTAIESGLVTDTGKLTDAGTQYLADKQPDPQEQLQPDPQEQLQPDPQEQFELQTETQPILQKPVNTVKRLDETPPPPPSPPRPPLPVVNPPIVNPPPVKEIDPVDGEEIDVTDITGDRDSPENKAKAKKQSKLKFNQSLNMALQSVQAVSAKTPPGAEIDYLYDIGGDSVFAPMKAQSKYLPREGYYDPQIERQFAQGGIVAFDAGGDVPEEIGALMHHPKLLQRGKNRMDREYPEDPSMIGEIAAGFHPIIGPALSIKDFEKAAEEDNYLGMGLAALGMIPIAGGAIKGYNHLIKPALRERALEKELVKNYGKIPKGQPIPEGYIGGLSEPIPRLPNAESQAGYYAQPKFQTEYGREFTHDLVHSSPSPSITSFDPTSAINTSGNRFATLNPDKARGASGNPLMNGGHAADDITTFLSNSPHYSQQYLPSDFLMPTGVPLMRGMPMPKETYKPGATMYPVSARLGNVYDPTMPEAGKIASSFLDSLTPSKGMSDKEFKHYKQQFSQGLLNGKWQAIESAPFRSFLKEQGFDSFAYLKGGGKDQVKNYGVFEPSRIRGKYAEFNPAAAHESDIMKANGGLIDLLRSK